jgi:hypothetical protein
MTKENIIDFAAYTESRDDTLWGTEGVSDELSEAIGQLIARLKEANPIQHQPG